MALHALNELGKLPRKDYRMPVLFIGHGSPMNGIEHNVFSNQWHALAATLPVPEAVVVVSAHWLSRGTRVTAMSFPRTVHDFGGFPEALFHVQYPAPGNPALAAEMAGMVRSTHVEPDHDWGLDHGAWSVVRQMYPEAHIPVLQLSIDYTKDAGFHYTLARELRDLRDKGVLVIGSGNMVHNLRMVAWDKMEVPGFGYDWTLEMNTRLKELILRGDHQALIRYEDFGAAGRLAIPTPEHYLPLIYTLGLRDPGERLSFFNDQAVAGSLTMTSVQFG